MNLINGENEPSYLLTDFGCNSSCEFRENRCSGTHTLPRGVNNFYLYFPYLLCRLCQIRYNRSAHIDIDQFFSFHENRPRERPHFACVPKSNNICSCAVKPYDILTVKNALVKSVWCVTGRTICSPVSISVTTFSCFRFMRTDICSLFAVCPEHELATSTAGFRLTF